jgi:hypothetical protein
MSIVSPVRKLRFRSHDTRRNLPATSSQKRGEVNFLHAFEKVWVEGAASAPARTHAAGKEFGMEGFGRADFIFVAWRKPKSEDFTALSMQPPLEIIAFEAKISDWRKGLMQASRYRYFANLSILLLPPSVAEVAARFLPTFRSVNVGLWEFDASTGKLHKHFTPRKRKPLNAKVRNKAIHLIEQSL